MQCSAILKNGKYCRNNSSDGRFCHQHIGKERRNLRAKQLAQKFGPVFVILTLALAIFGGDVRDYLKGYKVSVIIQDSPDRLVAINGEEHLRVEVKNQGGYDLDNLSGTLAFNCTQRDQKIFGNAILDSGRAILAKDAPSEFLNFKESQLTNLIRNNTVPCSDAFFLLTNYKKQYKEADVAYLVNGEAFEFFNNNLAVRRTNFSGPNIDLNLCIYCNLSVQVHVRELVARKFWQKIDESSFSKSEQSKYAGLLTNFDRPQQISVNKSAASDVSMAITSVLNYDKCRDLEECAPYFCNIVNERFNAGIACNQQLSPCEVVIREGKGIIRSG